MKDYTIDIPKWMDYEQQERFKSLVAYEVRANMEARIKSEARSEANGVMHRLTNNQGPISPAPGSR